MSVNLAMFFAGFAGSAVLTTISMLRGWSNLATVAILVAWLLICGLGLAAYFWSIQ